MFYFTCKFERNCARAFATFATLRMRGLTQRKSNYTMDKREINEEI